MGVRKWLGRGGLIVAGAAALYGGLIAWGPGIERHGQNPAIAPPQPVGDCRPPDDLYGPWAKTAIAFEHFDSGRTHNFGCATFGGTHDGANIVSARQLPGSYPTPYNWVIDEAGNGYVYGGAYGDFPGVPGSFVARIAPDGSEVWRRQLFDAPAHPERWNYPGVVGLHSNGSLYAVFGTSLARIDPESGEAIATIELPSSDPANTAYNGFNGFADGALVMKTVNRAKGCDLQGFSAFLRCEGALEVGPSEIAVVDPDSMQVIASVTAPEHIGGRLTATCWQGVDRLYLAGEQSMFRYNWDGKALALDEGWGPVPFMREGQTPAPAAAVIGDWIVAQTNALPAKTPMSLVAISQRNGRMVRIDPFADLPFWAAPPPRRSFLPAMLTVDPDNGRVYVMDAAMGLVAAYGFDQGDGSFELLWRVRQRTMNFSTLIGPPGERVFVATDIGRFCPLLSCLRSYQQEAVVFRDAATGRELARSGPLPKMTSGALVTPANGGELRYLGLAGDVFALSVAPKEGR
ncbi:hypothetical protein [Altererythrobacter sp. Z27]|uniref:hypothetical protein n=1 Tax=Altererythrobacter sp. Z27 TaxID=3461147 RepID=UPI0040440114